MNIIVISGRLTKEVEKKKSENSGTEWVKFSIAVDKYAKDKEKTSIFVDCVAFAHTANYIAKYCRKGQLITIQGELDVQNKKLDDGSYKTYCNVIVKNVVADKPQTTQAAQTEDTADSMPFEL